MRDLGQANARIKQTAQRAWARPGMAQPLPTSLGRPCWRCSAASASTSCCRAVSRSRVQPLRRSSAQALGRLPPPARLVRGRLAMRQCSKRLLHPILDNELLHVRGRQATSLCKGVEDWGGPAARSTAKGVQEAPCRQFPVMARQLAAAHSAASCTWSPPHVQPALRRRTAAMPMRPPGPSTASLPGGATPLYCLLCQRGHLSTFGRGWCSYIALSICSRLSAAVAPGRFSSSTTLAASPFCAPAKREGGQREGSVCVGGGPTLEHGSGGWPPRSSGSSRQTVGPPGPGQGRAHRARWPLGQQGFARTACPAPPCSPPARVPQPVVASAAAGG